ncbi:uncharacterized protein B0T15DRAFT_315031 [Chaetomium strumarium]|uniref:Uncharacterized protein n=1 Tax=Chaetomium strumarium TaxID=1170767 RepID=A0AAJ0GMM5_9PEZI|nr:hypothetical protein B0T15DRAFT_315031 [Chaetomium strumarium]
MEDEEYYHMMLEDMERLTRVHHHYPSLPNTRDPSPARQPHHQQQQPQPHSPWVSGLRLALDNALNAGLERLRSARAGQDGRRGSTGSTGSTS